MPVWIKVVLFVAILTGIFYMGLNAYLESNSYDSQSVDVNYEKFKAQGVPHFVGKGLAGNSFDFKSVDAPVVIVNFWASWCGPCVEEFPSLIKLIENQKGKVSLIAISLDSERVPMEEFLKNYSIPKEHFEILWDPDFVIANQFGSTKLPESFVLDQNRKLIKKVVGSVNWNSPDVLGWFQAQ